MLVSRNGQSVRFHADDATLRPMARATQGVIGMKFRGNDALLAMDVAREDAFVVTVTDGGFAKRTAVTEWAPKGRGILGVKAMRLASDERGALVGAIVAHEGDEIFAIKSSGEVIRTPVGDIRATGRDTMGVTLTSVGEGDAVVAVTRNPEADEVDEVEGATDAEGSGGGDPALSQTDVVGDEGPASDGDGGQTT
jgi:DNA gyrase subunit A